MSALRNDGLFSQVTIQGITTGLGAEVQKAQGFPYVTPPPLKALKRPLEGKTYTHTHKQSAYKPAHASELALAAFRHAHTQTHAKQLVG